MRLNSNNKKMKMTSNANKEGTDIIVCTEN
jgi:hypothetical protein